MKSDKSLATTQMCYRMQEDKDAIKYKKHKGAIKCQSNNQKVPQIAKSNKTKVLQTPKRTVSIKRKKPKINKIASNLRPNILKRFYEKIRKYEHPLQYVKRNKSEHEMQYLKNETDNIMNNKDL